MRKLYLFTLTAVLALVMAACDDLNNNDDPVSEGEAEAEENNNGDNNENNGNSDEEEDKAGEEFDVGETVKLGDAKITVTDVEKSQGDELEEPSEGNEFVLVHLKIENDSDETISYNELDFAMENSSGQKDEVDFLMVEQDDHLGSGDLTEDGEVEGILAFEQEEDDDLKLYYEPDFWNEDNKILFNL